MENELRPVGFPYVDGDGQQQQGSKRLLVRVVGLVPLQNSERKKEGRDSHFLFRQFRVCDDLLQDAFELVGKLQGLKGRITVRWLCFDAAEFRVWVDVCLTGMLRPVDLDFFRSRRQFEFVADMVTKLALKLRKRQFVITPRAFQRLQLRQEFEIGDFGMLERRDELFSPLFGGMSSGSSSGSIRSEASSPASFL